MKIDTINIFLDNNILKKGYPICKEIDDIIEDQDLNTKAKINLFISEVVFWEFQYHYILKVNEIIRAHNSQVNELNIRLDKKYKKVVFNKTKIESIIKKLLKKKNITIVKIPNNIDFRQLAKDAAFHLPPFNNNKEKGFRDAIIANTAAYYANKHKSEKTVIVAEDEELRDCSKLLSEKQSNLKVYDSIPNFISETKLTLEKLDKEFTDKILAKVKSEFYDISNSSSFYFSENIEQKIHQDFSHVLNQLTSKNTSSSSYSHLNTYTYQKHWEPIDNGKFSVLDTEFIDKDENDIYFWKTTIEFNQKFEETSSVFSNHPINYSIKFSINWSSEINKEVVFQNKKLDRITASTPKIEDLSFVGFTTKTANALSSLATTTSLMNISSTVESINSCFEPIRNSFSALQDSIKPLQTYYTALDYLPKFEQYVDSVKSLGDLMKEYSPPKSLSVTSDDNKKDSAPIMTSSSKGGK